MPSLRWYHTSKLSIANNTVMLQSGITETLGTMDEGVMRLLIDKQDSRGFCIQPDKYTTRHRELLKGLIGDGVHMCYVDDRSVTRTISLGLYCVIDRRNCSFGASRFILGEMIKVLPRIVGFGML